VVEEWSQPLEGVEGEDGKTATPLPATPKTVRPDPARVRIAGAAMGCEWPDSKGISELRHRSTRLAKSYFGGSEPCDG
jgi:hypothetical protein